MRRCHQVALAGTGALLLTLCGGLAGCNGETDGDNQPERVTPGAPDQQDDRPNQPPQSPPGGTDGGSPNGSSGDSPY